MYTRFLATCPGDPKSEMDWSNNYGELPGLETGVLLEKVQDRA